MKQCRVEDLSKPDVNALISQRKPGLAEQLLSYVLGASLALSLVTTRGFGLMLALLIVIGPLSLRLPDLVALRRQDAVFLALFNTYPLLVAFSMLLEGTGDVSLFDNASRFLLLSVGYVVLRAKSFDLSYVVVGAMIGCGLTCCASLFHYAHGLLVPQNYEEARSVGFDNPIVFAQVTFFLLLVAVTPTRLHALPESRVRGLLVTVVLLASISLVISQSRSVLLAFLVLCGYLLFCDVRLSSSRTTKSAVLLGAICVVAFLFNSSHLEHLSGTASELISNYGQFDQRTSLGQRLSLWSLSGQLIVERPAFGYGIGQFQQALNSLPDAASLTETVRSYRHAHNDFVQIAVEQGLVGLAIFIAALSALLFLALRERFGKAALHLLVGTIAGWLFFALTQTQFAHQKTTTLFALLLALGFSHGMNEKFRVLDRNSA